MISKVHEQLKDYYIRLDPHAETWELWIKGEKSTLETYEVAVGTILVQNTNWRNVNKAIANLKRANVFSFEELQKIEKEDLEELIKPAGFYIQKSIYLKSLSNLLSTCILNEHTPSREELLACKGVGKETADSILVYCFQQPVPIVGTYTRRFLARIYGDIDYLRKKYEIIQEEIIKVLEKNFEVLGRFHALVVVHGQNYCQKNNPMCLECFLQTSCTYALKTPNRFENRPNSEDNN
ncbi:MAG: endonuclease [Candidatus Heimdallarchaeota archaeon]|nr:MAG: endonuclease [Candidatus Heimdallarchaeota archaeon]